MSVEDFSQLSPHDLARAEIEGWRAACLDIFSRGESLIGALLEDARAAGLQVNLYPLATQRTVETMRMIDMLGEDTEAKDACAVLESWQSLESRADLLAHGVATETVDREGNWYALFDMIAFRGNRSVRGRWAVSRPEAEAFLQELEHSFIIINSQLGAIRQEFAGQRA